MKKLVFTLLLLGSSVLFADVICTTGPNGDTICTDDGGDTPTIIFH